MDHYLNMSEDDLEEDSETDEVSARKVVMTDSISAAEDLSTKVSKHSYCIVCTVDESRNRCRVHK